MNYTEANDLRYKLTNLPLPEDIDRAAFNALLTAGVAHCLFQELDALADHRDALKLAAIEVSQAADWATVAKFTRDRDAAIKSGAYVERAVL